MSELENMVLKSINCMMIMHSYVYPPQSPTAAKSTANSLYALIYGNSCCTQQRAKKVTHNQVADRTHCLDIYRYMVTTHGFYRIRKTLEQL